MEFAASDPTGGRENPSDVDLNRVQSVAESLGHNFLEGEDRLVYPWSNHVLIARLENSGHTVPTVLLFEAEMREKLSLSDIGPIARSITEWNHERLGPTASLRVGDDGEVAIHSRLSVLTDEGLSDDQLAEHLRLGVETTVLFVREILSQHPELDAAVDDASGKRHSRQDLIALQHVDAAEKRLSAEDNALRPTQAEQQHSEWIAEEDMTMEDDVFYDFEFEEPSEVTTDRVRQALGDMGITRTTGEDETLVAWINGILFGFFIDNGPSFLVKGHWDPGLDPDADFLRMFLLCNDWNEESLTTKAYTHIDDEGLQVRVEFTIAVGKGLNDGQLEHNAAVAVNQILHALDTISVNATGDTAVEWPS